MTRIFILLFLLSPLALFSQNFIGKSRPQVKKELQKMVEKNDSLNAVLNDNDSALVLSYTGPATRPVNFIYRFNKAGNCSSEKVMAGCDSCYKKYLSHLLSQKKFEWKKINENQYISRYADHMMIELPGNPGDFSYAILLTDWTKELYQMLTGN